VSSWLVHVAAKHHSATDIKNYQHTTVSK